jgi:hypothetical protein
MRRTLTVCRSGLSVAAAVVLLTACGGSDGEESASSSSASSSSAAETTGGQSDSEFCTQAADVLDQVEATLTGNSDPSTIPTVLQAAADQIRAIEAPAELESDWTTFADGIEKVAAAAQVDFNDPNAVAAFQQQVAQLQQESGAAFANVQTYLTDECGIDTGSSEPASPSS